MIQTLLLIGVMALPVTRNIGGVKPSDVAFGLAALMSVMWLPGAIRTTPLTRAALQATAVIVLLAFFIVAATLSGYEKYDIHLDKDGTIMLARYVLDVALFLTLYCAAKQDEKFRERVMTWLVLSAALLIVLETPGISRHFYTPSGGRFVGFEAGGQPNTVAQILAIAAALAWVRAVAAYFDNDGRRMRQHAFILVALWYMIWTTESRAALLATLTTLPVGALLATALRAPRDKFRRIRRIVAGSTAVVATGGFFAFQAILPALAFLLPRLVPTVPGAAGGLTMSALVQLNFTSDTATRFVSSLYYWPLVLHNPLGLGVSYLERFAVFQPDLEVVEGPNTALDLPIVAGYGGVACVLALAAILGRHAYVRIRDNGPGAINTIAAITALFCQWTGALMLGTPLFNHYFWILLSLAVA